MDTSLKYAKAAEVAKHFRRSTKTLQRWEETLGFPRRVLPMSGGGSLYVVKEVLDWEEEQLKLRYRAQA